MFQRQPIGYTMNVRSVGVEVRTGALTVPPQAGSGPPLAQMNQQLRRQVEDAFRPRTYAGGMAAGPVGVEHPLYNVPMQYRVDVVPDDPDQQVEYTIGLMRQYAVEDSVRPEIRQHAAALRGATDRETVRNVWADVKGRMRFLADEAHAAPLGLGDKDTPVVETLIRPVDTLQVGGVGDCDDYSMLVASLLRSLGVKVNYATVAADPRNPGSYSHVYPVAYPDDGSRLVADASHGPYVGWEAPNAFGKLQEWPLELEVYPVLVAAALIGLVGHALQGRFW